jgi:hypothetical protein
LWAYMCDFLMQNIAIIKESLQIDFLSEELENKSIKFYISV